MAIEGKKRYVVYLTESEVEYLRFRMKQRGPHCGGLSWLIDDYLCKLAGVLRTTGIPGTPMTWAKVGRMAIKSLMK
jgi:hypothetical protein